MAEFNEVFWQVSAFPDQEQVEENIVISNIEIKAKEVLNNLVSRWYETDKNAKRPIVDEFKEMYKLYINDHWSLTDSNGNPLRTPEQQKNRPNVVENIAFALVEGIASEFAQEIELIDYPVERGDEEAAEKMTNLKKFIFNKNRAHDQRIKGLRWFFIYGTIIFHPHWDPDWKGGKGPNRWNGDIRFKALHPLALIPDARCKESINEGARCHKITWYTLEAAKDLYPDKAHLMQEQIMSEDDYIADISIDEEGYIDNDFRNQQIPIIETWYIGKPLLPTLDDETGEVIADPGTTGLHVIWWAGEEQKIYLKHKNFIYYDPDSTPEYPFIVKQCYPREGSIWGYGEMYFLKNPQIVRNKTAEIILEGHSHQSIGQTLYDSNAISKKQQKVIQEKGTIPGMWFQVEDTAGIKRFYGQGVSGSLQNEMQRNLSLLETIVGRFDVSQGRTPGGITAFKAIAELSARAQVRLRIKEMALNSLYEDTGNYINRLIALYYTEKRQYRIMGKGNSNAEMNQNRNGAGQQYEYHTYDRNEMLKVYDSATQEVMPLKNMLGAIPPGVDPVEFLNQDRFEIYFPEFDCYSQVSTVSPSDRFYNIEVAKELLMAGLMPPQIFLKVMDTGRFPPMEEVIEALDQMNAQKMALAQAQNPQLQGAVLKQGDTNENQTGGRENPADIAKAAEEAVLQILTPEEREIVQSLPPDQKLQAIYEIVQQAAAAEQQLANQQQ